MVKSRSHTSMLHALPMGNDSIRTDAFSVDEDMAFQQQAAAAAGCALQTITTPSTQQSASLASTIRSEESVWGNLMNSMPSIPSVWDEKDHYDDDDDCDDNLFEDSFGNDGGDLLAPIRNSSSGGKTKEEEFNDSGEMWKNGCSFASFDTDGLIDAEKAPPRKPRRSHSNLVKQQMLEHQQQMQGIQDELKKQQQKQQQHHHKPKQQTEAIVVEENPASRRRESGEAKKRSASKSRTVNRTHSRDDMAPIPSGGPRGRQRGRTGAPPVSGSSEVISSEEDPALSATPAAAAAAPVATQPPINTTSTSRSSTLLKKRDSNPQEKRRSRSMSRSRTVGSRPAAPAAAQSAESLMPASPLHNTTTATAAAAAAQRHLLSPQSSSSSSAQNRRIMTTGHETGVQKQPSSTDTKLGGRSSNHNRPVGNNSMHLERSGSVRALREIMSASAHQRTLEATTATAATSALSGSSHHQRPMRAPNSGTRSRDSSAEGIRPSSGRGRDRGGSGSGQGDNGSNKKGPARRSKSRSRVAGRATSATAASMSAAAVAAAISLQRISSAAAAANHSGSNNTNNNHNTNDNHASSTSLLTSRSDPAAETTARPRRSRSKTRKETDTTKNPSSLSAALTMGSTKFSSCVRKMKPSRSRSRGPATKDDLHHIFSSSDSELSVIPKNKDKDHRVDVLELLRTSWNHNNDNDDNDNAADRDDDQDCQKNHDSVAENDCGRRSVSSGEASGRSAGRRGVRNSNSHPSAMSPRTPHRKSGIFRPSSEDIISPTTTTTATTHTSSGNSSRNELGLVESTSGGGVGGGHLAEMQSSKASIFSGSSSAVFSIPPSPMVAPSSNAVPSTPSQTSLLRMQVERAVLSNSRSRSGGVRNEAPVNEPLALPTTRRTRRTTPVGHPRNALGKSNSNTDLPQGGSGNGDATPNGDDESPNRAMRMHKSRSNSSRGLSSSGHARHTSSPHKAPRPALPIATTEATTAHADSTTEEHVPPPPPPPIQESPGRFLASPAGAGRPPNRRRHVSSTRPTREPKDHHNHAVAAPVAVHVE